jgi:hypothetical protein
MPEAANFDRAGKAPARPQSASYIHDELIGEQTGQAMTYHSGTFLAQAMRR